MTDNAVITIPQNFGQVPAHLQNAGVNDMSEGVGGGFGIISFRGKVWRTKFRGEETAMMREDGSGPKSSIQVVVVRAAPVLSKIYFEGGYKEGDNAAPDCFSTNGVVPDPAANKKQARACAGCPKNAWGSRITEAGKAVKACSDSKRLAVVPAADIKNESMGGPMLLRVPAASLQDMAMFANQMAQQGFNYNTYVMDISFDINDAFPKFVFKPIRPLTPEEFAIVQELGDGPVAQRILVEAVDAVSHDTAVPAQATETLPEASALFAGSKPNGAAQPAATQAAPVQASTSPLVAETAAVPVDPNTAGRRLYETDKQLGLFPEPVTQGVTPIRPLFDPMTGKPIVYQDEKPAPAQVNVPPLVQEPSDKVAQAGTVPDFDKALDALLGS